MTGTRGPSGAERGGPAPGGMYRLLLWASRAVWGSCGLGVVVMVAALALRSPELVTVVRVALVAALAALVVALLLFVGLIAVPAQLPDVLPEIRRAPVRRRAEALFAVTLLDLLDPD